MIVPAIPQPLTEEEIAALQLGDKHHVDSGMGGSYRVEFIGRQEDKFVFEDCEVERRAWGPYRYTIDEVRHNVYRLIAQDPYFRGKTIDR